MVLISTTLGIDGISDTKGKKVCVSCALNFLGCDFSR